MTDRDAQQEPKRRVVCAALLFPDGTIVCGPRHFDETMRRLIKRALLDIHADHGACEQGFVDQRGEYMSRQIAWTVAEEAGQIIRRVGGDGHALYSENLY